MPGRKNLRSSSLSGRRLPSPAAPVRGRYEQGHVQHNDQSSSMEQDEIARNSCGHQTSDTSSIFEIHQYPGTGTRGSIRVTNFRNLPATLTVREGHNFAWIDVP
eukprot:2010471-Rhodomonas_salina.2